MSLIREHGILHESIVEVIPHVYQITYRSANVLVIAEDSITLVDTGYKAGVPRVADFVHSLGRALEEIGLIVLTHNHFDHVSGVRELKRLTGATVACHGADIIASTGPVPYPESVQKTIELRPFAALRAWLGVGPEDVDIRLEGGEVLSPLGGIRVIHTPGHTPGSICLLSGQHRLLIAGDTLIRHGETLRCNRKSTSTDIPREKESIRALAEEDFDSICLGHGAPVAGGAKDKLVRLVSSMGD